VAGAAAEPAPRAARWVGTPAAKEDVVTFF